MKECTEQEFNTFIAAKSYKDKMVVSGSVALQVFYDEPEYDISKRDAYKTVGLPNNKFFIKG